MKNFDQEARAKAVFLVFFLGWLCFFLTCAQRSLQAQPLPQPMLREQLNQEISNLFRRSSQEVRRLDSPPLPDIQKCATPLLKQALRHRELLDPENQFILHRPTQPVDDDYYGKVQVWSYERPLGHFRLYYTENNRNGDAVEGSDGNQETVPDYVIKLTDYFEYSWSLVVGTLGYRAPGGDKIEVFLLYIGPYGITTSDENGLYIMMKNSYQAQEIKLNLDWEGKSQGAMKVTAVHEFFHVVQAGYDHWPTLPAQIADNTWWEENTAVWIEDEVYNYVDDYRNYLGWPYKDLNDNGRWDAVWPNNEPFLNILMEEQLRTTRGYGWFDHPNDSLTALSGEGSSFKYFEYGGVIWAKFLSERFGQGIIKTIFEHVLPSSYHVLLAIDQSIKEVSGCNRPFAQVFIQFKLANLQQDYKEGKNYPIPLHEDAPLKSSHTNQLPPLSCQYFSFKESSSAGGSIHIYFHNKSQADLVALAVPATSYRSLPESSPAFGVAQLITLDNNQEGSYDFSFYQNPSCSKLIIIPINLSWNEKAYYTLTTQSLTGSMPPAPQIGSITPGIRLDGYLAVRLGWEPVQKTGRYQIWRGRDQEYQTLIFQSEQIAPPYQDSNSYQDTDHSLDEEQSYLYQLKFADSTGSSFSEATVMTAPLPLHNLRARYKTSSAPFSIEISFEVDPNIQSYQIERTIRQTTSPPEDPVIRKDKTSIVPSTRSIIYNDSQVTENTEYIYTVTVYDVHDSFFRKDVSIEFSNTVPPASNKKKGGGGCFITAATLMTF